MRIRLRDGTGSIDLKHLVSDIDRHGNVRLYVRIKGRPKVRLRQPVGSEAFLDEYRAAAKSGADGRDETGPARQGSFRWLCQQYYQSARFRKLDPRTQRVRRGILDAICEKKGDNRYRMMEPRHVAQLRDEKINKPESANARVKAIRQVFRWATHHEVGLADRNPALDVEYLPATNPDGFHTWTVAEVRQYETAHPVGTRARLALALLAFTGVRRSDVVRLGRQMEQGETLNFTEAKGRSRRPKSRAIPILPELRAELDATPSGHLTYLVTEFGQPFTANGFGNRFRKWCDLAGLGHCSAHGLRKAGATIAAENGATERQLMAIFGWDSSRQAAGYTRQADRRKLAADAMHLLVPDRTENEKVPPEQAIAVPPKPRRWNN